MPDSSPTPSLHHAGHPRVSHSPTRQKRPEKRPQLPLPHPVPAEMTRHHQPYNQPRASRRSSKTSRTARGTDAAQTLRNEAANPNPTDQHSPDTQGKRTTNALVAQGIEHRFPNAVRSCAPRDDLDVPASFITSGAPFSWRPLQSASTQARRRDRSHFGARRLYSGHHGHPNPLPTRTAANVQ
jgi:hypothetical protein